MFQEACKMIQDLNNTELIELCNDIYDYGKGYGDIDKESKFYKIFKANEKKFSTIDFLRDLIISESTNRFENVVKLLFLKQPWRFIK